MLLALFLFYCYNLPQVSDFFNTTFILVVICIKYYVEPKIYMHVHTFLTAIMFLLHQFMNSVQTTNTVDDRKRITYIYQSEQNFTEQISLLIACLENHFF